MRPFTASILSVGSELTSGRTVDTNAAFLAVEVRRAGGRVLEVRVVPDDLSAIVAALKALARKSHLLVVSGGLGPTRDDLTREALAKAVGVRLRLHPPSLRAIERRFRRAGRPMSDNNRLQALVPTDGLPLPNALGTASGIWMRLGPCRVAALPGVPFEMKGMWREQVLPRIPRGPALHTRLLHCAGLPESEVDRRLSFLMARGRTPEVGLNVGGGVVTVVISATSKALIAQDEALIRDLLGDAVFGVDGDTLASVIVKTLKRNRQTLALAESATGGLIASLITAVPGASEVLLEGRVVYTEAAKQRLGVPAALLRRYGAVSEAVTRNLAARVRRVSKSTYGLAVTGVAGPSGGIRRTPVGTVFCALAGPHGVLSRLWRIPGDRGTIRRRAATGAMDLLRRAFSFV